MCLQLKPDPDGSQEAVRALLWMLRHPAAYLRQTVLLFSHYGLRLLARCSVGFTAMGSSRSKQMRPCNMPGMWVLHWAPNRSRARARARARASSSDRARARARASSSGTTTQSTGPMPHFKCKRMPVTKLVAIDDSADGAFLLMVMVVVVARTEHNMVINRMDFCLGLHKLGSKQQRFWGFLTTDVVPSCVQHAASLA
jgi:hypothetical protein